MKETNVNNQAELDACLARGGEIPLLRGGGVFEVHDSSQVRAYGSSQVTAYGSSQVRAYGSSQVRAYDSSQVRASNFVAVTIHGTACKVKGGKVIKIVSPKTTAQWATFYGVEVVKGVATVFKGLDGNFKSRNGAFDFTPGTTPSAPDWDGGERECGGGLHFSPTPGHTLEFKSDAKKFVACPVLLKDMRSPKDDDNFPNKIKASKCCGPVYEVDIMGHKV